MFSLYDGSNEYYKLSIYYIMSIMISMISIVSIMNSRSNRGSNSSSSSSSSSSNSIISSMAIRLYLLNILLLWRGREAQHGLGARS